MFSKAYHINYNINLSIISYIFKPIKEVGYVYRIPSIFDKKIFYQVLSV